MGLPGFRAEATIYRSTFTYQVGWASGEVAAPVLNGDGLFR